MREILIIAKKEFARFFSNKATAFIALFLPGLLMAGMYTAIGNMEGVGAPDEEETFTVAVSHLPASMEAVAKDSPIAFVDVKGAVPDKDMIRQAINDEKYDAYAIFPDNFDEIVAGLVSSQTHDEPSPLIAIYYDGSVEKSSYAFEGLSEILNAYETSMVNVFDINAGEEQYDLAADDSMFATILSTMMPMFILMMLVASIGTISSESIAGEKERGTIATLLSTPTQRNSIVWGKLITIASIGVVSTIFTIAGVIVGLANMSDQEISLSAYSVSDYVLLFVLLISFSLAISVLLIIFSALAPNIRSAQIYFTTVYIAIMALGLLVGMNGGSSVPTPYYLIPFYNTARALVDVFAFEATGLTVGITALVNIALSVLGVFVAQKILNSERFMFQK